MARPSWCVGSELGSVGSTDEGLNTILISKHSFDLPSPTTGTQLKAKIVKNRATAEKDNSTIYLEPIPAETTLKPVATACMVKVSSFLMHRMFVCIHGWRAPFVPAASLSKQNPTTTTNK